MCRISIAPLPGRRCRNERCNYHDAAPGRSYRGVEPFRFTDQQIFAARTEETWTLLSNVTLYRAVLLYGASGTGKSSLINAGFLPQILKENQIPDRLRVQPFAGREIKVERIRITGTEEQAAYLPSSFAPADSNTSAESIELSLADFKARLEKFRLAPASAESGDLFRAPRATPRPLLIFDQFEEFITLFEEAQRMDTNETGGGAKVALAAQADILQTLVELIQDETLPVKIIFAFREDYLAKLSLLFEYCPGVAGPGAAPGTTQHRSLTQYHPGAFHQSGAPGALSQTGKHRLRDQRVTGAGDCR